MRNYGFRVEISGSAVDTTSTWTYLMGGEITIQQSSSSTRGTDQFQDAYTPGISYVGEVMLVGPLAERPDVINWITDILEGSSGSPYRDITITEVDRDGADMGSFTYYEAFPTAFRSTTLDKNGSLQVFDCLIFKAQWVVL